MAKRFPRFEVDGESLTEGIWDLSGESGVEFADEMGFASDGGKFIFESVAVPGGHAKDMGRPFRKRVCELLRAVFGKNHPHLGAGLYGLGTGRLIGHRVHACGSNFEVHASFGGVTEESFGHGAAAGVSCADEEDAFGRLVTHE